MKQIVGRQKYTEKKVIALKVKTGLLLGCGKGLEGACGGQLQALCSLCFHGGDYTNSLSCTVFWLFTVCDIFTKKKKQV